MRSLWINRVRKHCIVYTYFIFVTLDIIRIYKNNMHTKNKRKNQFNMCPIKNLCVINPKLKIK